MINYKIFRFLLKFTPEKFLLEHGVWSEIDGEPMNSTALEFDRRNK